MKTVRIFYHVTRKEYVNSILNSALTSGKTLGRCNKYYGRHGDPSYIYFWNKRNAKTLSKKIIRKEHGAFDIKTHTLLEITIPVNHPVERDYDQLLYILNNLKTKDWRNLWVKPFLQQFGIKFNGPLSKQNLMHHINLIPNHQWACHIGSYRTPEPIRNEHIREIGFKCLLTHQKIVKLKLRYFLFSLI